MSNVKEKKAKPKAKPKIDPAKAAASWMAWMERERGKAPFLCRSYHLSESGFKF